MTGAEVILGLPATFNACVALIGIVQIGRQMGGDYTRYLFRIEAAGLRLSRWGESLKLNSNQAVENLVAAYPLYAQSAVVRLEDIRERFERVQKRSLQDKQMLSQDSNSADLTVWEPAEDNDMSRVGMRSICERMKFMRLGRSRGTFVEQTKWALYQKSTYNSLVENLEDSIEELIDLFPVIDQKEAQLSLARQEATELSQVQEATATDFKFIAEELRSRDAGLVAALQEALAESSRPQAAQTVRTVVHQRGDYNSGVMIGHISGNSTVHGR